MVDKGLLRKELVLQETEYFLAAHILTWDRFFLDVIRFDRRTVCLPVNEDKTCTNDCLDTGLLVFLLNTLVDVAPLCVFGIKRKFLGGKLSFSPFQQVRVAVEIEFGFLGLK